MVLVLFREKCFYPLLWALTTDRHRHHLCASTENREGYRTVRGQKGKDRKFISQTLEPMNAEFFKKMEGRPKQLSIKFMGSLCSTELPVLSNTSRYRNDSIIVTSMFTRWILEIFDKGISGCQFTKIKHTSLDDLWGTFPEQDLLASVCIMKALWRTQRNLVS